MEEDQSSPSSEAVVVLPRLQGMIKALVPEGPFRALIEPLPADLEVVSDAAPDVQFALFGREAFGRLREAFDELPSLLVVQTLSAGIEWLKPFVPQGVTLCNGSGIHDAPVAEWIVGSLINLQRRLPDFWRLQLDSCWDLNLNPPGHATGPPLVGPIDDLPGKKVLILGHGSIGRAVAERLKPFDVELLYIAEHRRPGVETMDALPRLLPAADAVVLLLPLLPATEGLVDKTFLSKMKPGAFLINASRGKLVRTEDLIDAAREGKVKAALDVTYPEPLPADHPLWQTPNVLITPHVGGATVRSEERGYRFVGEQLRRFARGEPLANVQQLD